MDGSVAVDYALTELGLKRSKTQICNLHRVFQPVRHFVAVLGLPFIRKNYAVCFRFRYHINTSVACFHP